MIIVLNAPPGAGKDTIAKRMAEASTAFRLASMKEPMWDIAKAMLGTKYDEFVRLYNDRDTKEKAFEFLGGLSPRGFFIWISEKVCKPLFGERFFGERMLSRVQELKPYEVVLSDGGFPSELLPALEAGETIMLVRLHREGFTFEGDSRDYIRAEDLPGEEFWTIDVDLEEGEIDKAVTQIISAYEVLLEVY
ncbi:hypothetical protein KpnPVR702_26 [Klebsiella phage KpnP_VR702]|nr:hypothetical protein KpnPVR702_26 [Klebsiella phage KpnP_VR702]